MRRRWSWPAAAGRTDGGGRKSCGVRVRLGNDSEMRLLVRASSRGYSVREYTLGLAQINRVI
jgi:hypothetical protein